MTLDDRLKDIDFELRPLVVGGNKYADEAVVTGKPEAKLAILSDLLEIIGEDFKHSNGKPMKNPSYECDECGEPNPEWTINIVYRELRKKVREYCD